VSESARENFIIGTERGILYPMQKQNPRKKFYPASDAMLCPDMKKTGLEDVLRSLESMAPRITVPEEIRLGALAAVERMLAVKVRDK
jgi:quinolinate synthase